MVSSDFEVQRVARVLAAFSLSLAAACNLPGMQQTQSQAPGGAPESAGASSAGSLVGSWQSGAESLEFRPDGTLLISGTAATYQVTGQTIVVSSANGTMTFPFELSGDQLVVTVDGAPVAYQRTSPAPGAPGSEVVVAQPFGAAPATAPGVAASGVAAPGTPGMAAASAPAGPPQGIAAALVGKWCYMSNVYANDGGRASETCFVLNPDGTYQYHSESSSSGQYGGTASQSDDTGTWQATDTTLTAHSRTGQTYTYQYQRQNHPKNNDPMLVFDGKAFVTYYQKPPW